jgi:hypothetical protein
MCNVTREWPMRTYTLVELEDNPSCIKELIPPRSRSLDIANVERALDNLPKMTAEEHAENLWNQMTELTQGPVSDSWKLIEIEIALDPKDKRNELAIYMDHINEGLNEAFPGRIKEDKAA